ncbi:MAG: type II toxin-antitoxin system PemK/MazF family toxin [Cyanobium sp.]
MLREPVTPFQAHDVVLVPFPFTDRSAQKRRPAVVLSQPRFQQTSGHVLLAMVTSARQSSWPLDWELQQVEAAGLPRPCLVRFKLFTLDQRLVLRPLGTLHPDDRQGVTSHLAQLLQLLPPTH